MDLKSFVETTLVQIAEGISSANDTLKEDATGAVVNPVKIVGSRPPTDITRSVAFDVALTVEEADASAIEGETKAKGGFLSIASVGASVGGERSSTRREESISRISFEVHMQQPGNITRTPMTAHTPLS